ncbi:MAG: hypothetical protein QNJ73_07670 [Gammaproteobacteria bacterium]|nr:hypothetical protein [Gammaproteobacteria bacterium]
MQDLDREVLFSNESFVIGILQAVSGAMVVASLAQVEAIVNLSGRTSFLTLISGAAIALALAVIAAYFKHQYKLWDVKKNQGRSNWYLWWMRRAIFVSVAVVLGSLVQFVVFAWVR